MKKSVLPILFLIIASSVFAQGWRPGEMEVKVRIADQAQAMQLHEMHLNGDFYPGHALLYLTPNELQQIEQGGFGYEILIDDLNTHYKHFWQTDAAYHTYQEIIDLADSLADNFPDICERHIYGTSPGGRELTALKISDNVTADENEAEVMFDGGIHGDEIGAAENVIRFARDLCLAYNEDLYITDLIDNREIWLYLMVNPDGRVNMSRYNNNGVDLNRDWGYMWDGWGGSTGAYSQPESKALRACSFNNQFVVHTTYHSGTVYISCPWSYRSSTPPDVDHILQLAGVYSGSSGYSNLEYGQGNTGMYAINGSTKDSNYGVMGSISWSMEISYSKQPPASQLMMYYNYNKPSMLAMIEFAGYGLEGTITDAVTGEPVAATVFVNDFLPAYSDPDMGDFHKYVLAGTYDILVKANGYADKLVTGVSVSSMSSTVTDIQLDPLNHRSVYRFISSRIQNNNPADEGYTWNVIGLPDNQNYSIGRNGWAVLDMQDIITDGAGNDIIVHEGDDTPEGYTLYAGETMDGPWHSIGTGTGTTEFDLAGCTLSEVRYLKIQDDGDGGHTVNDAGFDLDAIQAIIQPLNPPLNFTAEVQGQDVILSWEAPGTARGLTGYNVYRSGEVIAQNIAETVYTDGGLSPGSYPYYVRAIYDEGLSDPSPTITVVVEEIPQNYFSVVWDTPYNPMSVYVLLADIDENPMQAGDEIGIFDVDPNSGEEICVGAGVLVEELGGEVFLEIITSMDDGSNPDHANGFTPGNVMLFRLYTETTGEITEVLVSFPYPGYDEVFTAQGSAFAELQGSTPVILTFDPVWETPFNPMSFYVLGATVEGLDLQANAQIGIFDFDPVSGEEICVGAATLSQVITPDNFLEIVASMDDGSNPDQATGFTPGNGFVFKFITAGNVLIDQTTYSFPYTGYDEVFTAQGTAIVELAGSMQAPLTQTISLNIGWTGISSYLLPQNPDMASLVAQIPGFEFIQDNELFYQNGNNGNNLLQWDYTSGYFVKTSAAADFLIEGFEPANKTITLPAGRHLLPVLADGPVAIETLFSGQLDKVDVIRDAIGTKIYWPEKGINTLDQLDPGKAYLIRVNDEVTVGF